MRHNVKISIISTLAFLAISLWAGFGQSAYASDSCVQGICVGAGVIDSAGRVSTVTSIQGTQVNYSESSTGYSYSANASALSPEVSALGALKPGGILIDASNRIGKANHLFKDGRVDYSEISTGYEYVSASVSPEVASSANNDFFCGHRVIDASNRVGLISHVFQDGRVDYTESSTGYEYVQFAAKLSSEVNSLGALAAGVFLVDDSNRIGKINYIFKDGRADYTEVSTGYIYVSKSVSAETPSLSNGAIFPKSIVIDASNRIGAVNHAFLDGRVDYTEISTGYEYVSKTISAAISSLAQGTIKIGVIVVDASNRICIVKNAFADSRVDYTEISTGYEYVSKAVSPEVSSLLQGTIKAAVTVIDASNRISAVKHAFADGRVDYTEISTGYEYVNQSAQLSPEVPSNPLYDKNIEYATATYQIGKPLRFFQDGRIELGTLEGYQDIVTTLFTSTPAKFGFAPGALVSTSSGISALVLAVFENGTLKLQIAHTDPNTHKQVQLDSSAKAFGTNPSTLEQDKRGWILDFANVVQIKNSTNYANQDAGRLAALSADFPAIKAELLQYLTEHGKEILSPEMITAVSAALNSAN